MNYPLSLTFKIVTLASEVAITDASGSTVAYVKQKAFRLKEDIEVFADASKSRLLYRIKADRVIDFSARYHFSDAEGNPIGSIKREGMRSLWKATYEVADEAGRVVFRVSEANPWVKVFDSLMSEIPIVGMFTGYLFHPAYHLAGSDGTVSLTLEKQASLLGRKFVIHENRDVPVDDEVRGMLGMIMVVLLERMRG
ncbi:MAG: hypothetical protein ACKO5K_15670 [Armatimonadota bacterium]